MHIVGPELLSLATEPRGPMMTTAKSSATHKIRIDFLSRNIITHYIQPV